MCMCGENKCRPESEFILVDDVYWSKYKAVFSKDGRGHLKIGLIYQANEKLEELSRRTISARDAKKLRDYLNEFLGENKEEDVSEFMNKWSAQSIKEVAHEHDHDAMALCLEVVEKSLKTLQERLDSHMNFIFEHRNRIQNLEQFKDRIVNYKDEDELP